MNSSLNKDVRWKQRFNRFLRAFKSLDEEVELAQQSDMSDREKNTHRLAVIKAFEYTHEVAWNVLKDYLQEQGVSNLIASKDSTREAFKKDLIEDGDAWMEMIDARNNTVHGYDEEYAHNIYDAICGKFHPAFEQFKNRFGELYEQDNE